MPPRFRAGALLLLLPTALHAQSVAQRLSTLADGSIHLSFAARPDVCGGCGNGIVVREHSGEWNGECERGPVRVSLRMQGGRVVSARSWIGPPRRSGATPDGTDLGAVPAREAARALLGLVPRAGGGGEHLITAAALADSVEVWPDLLRLARDERLPGGTRRQAIFWVGQAAGREAVRGLDSIATDDRGDLDIRKHAVFALSQRPPEEGVPALIRIVRTISSAELRRTALFWLGQTEDPRALALFEEILGH